MVGHVAGLDGVDNLGQLGLVLGANLGQGQDCGGLLVDDCAETGLALTDDVRDTHLLAKRRQVDDELDGVNIVGDDNERRLLVLNQANDVVETVLDSVWLLGDVLLLLAVLDGGGLLKQTLLLLGLYLGAVLVEKLEQLSGSVAVGNVLELSERRWDLETHVEDLALALKTDILGPLDHARKVALWLDVLTDTEVTGSALDERVLWCVNDTMRDMAEHWETYLGLLLGHASL